MVGWAPPTTRLGSNGDAHSTDYETRLVMAMPFPGMDPYLEHPILWSSVHMRLIVALANQLGPRLRPHYVASVEERVFVEGPDQQRIPDAWIQKTRPEGHGPMPGPARRPRLRWSWKWTNWKSTSPISPSWTAIAISGW